MGLILVCKCLAGFFIACQLANMTTFYVRSQIVYQVWNKKLIIDCKVCFDNTLVSCPTWYKVMILSTQFSGMANKAISFSGVDIILNSKESSNIYFSANVSTFQIAILVLSNLFWAKYKYMSLKYGWLSNQPVFLLLWLVSVYLWVLFSVLPLKFY